MSKPLREWEDSFESLTLEQQDEIVEALKTLAQWPMFHEQFEAAGAWGLALGLYYLIHKQDGVSPEVMDLFLGRDLESD